MAFFEKKSFESVRLTGQESDLKKTLTAKDLVLLGLGAIVGTGVFALTGSVAAENSGPAVSISYLIAGIACIFIALVYTELASMMPTSGSVYTYSYVAFGRGFAWIAGSILIMEFTFASSVVASVWSGYFNNVLIASGINLPKSIISAPSEGGYINILSFGLAWIVAFMLILGTKQSTKLNKILVLVKLSVIAMFICLAIPHFDVSYFDELTVKGEAGIMHGASILFFAFSGFACLAATVEECKNPVRDMTIGIVGSLSSVIVIYIIVGILLVGIVHYSELNVKDALSLALQKNGNNVGGLLVAIGAVFGMVTVVMMTMFAASRIFYVAARDGLLPKSLLKINEENGTPYASLLFCAFSISLMSSLLPYKILAEMTSMAALTNYTVAIIVVILFRITRPEAERPFKCPCIYIVAPIALFSAGYLLSVQLFADGFNITRIGKLFCSWIACIFILYWIRSVFIRK